MSGHTPGKWSIRFDKGHIFSDGTVDHGGYRIDADGVEQLAYVWNFSDRVDPVSHSQDGTRPFGAQEAEANARLIAAAPLQHAELIACKQFLEDMHTQTPEWTIAESQKRHEAVCAAIAEATGEQP
jgi:hypothetical protein